MSFRETETLQRIKKGEERKGEVGASKSPNARDDGWEEEEGKVNEWTPYTKKETYSRKLKERGRKEKGTRNKKLTRNKEEHVLVWRRPAVGSADAAESRNMWYTLHSMGVRGGIEEKSERRVENRVLKISRFVSLCESSSFFGGSKFHSCSLKPYFFLFWFHLRPLVPHSNRTERKICVLAMHKDQHVALAIHNFAASNVETIQMFRLY